MSCVYILTFLDFPLVMHVYVITIVYFAIHSTNLGDSTMSKFAKDADMKSKVK